MVFSSLTFLLIFLPLTLGLYFLRGNVRWRNGVLLIASLVFYGWSDPVWILAMIASTLYNWIFALWIDRARRQGFKRLLVFLAVAGSLALLFYFKYSAFVINGVSELLGFEYRLADKVLPIGISFYTFQIMSYTLDVYWEKTPVQRKPLRLLLYVCCFPQLIAGPIVKYSDIEKRLGSRATSPDDFQAGMRRFAMGLAKKVLLANLCGMALAETTLAGTGVPLTVAGAWLSAFLYALQMYFDFSAYSDMAIGLGKVLGFTYRENFEYPFLSASISEYWRRWHISLGTWFQEYMLYPLLRGGPLRRLSMKKSDGKSRFYYRNMATIIATFIVWFSTGLWHGASMNFIVFGLYHWLLMTLENYVFAKALKRVPRVIRWAFTMPLVMIGLMIFYYVDFSLVRTHVAAMFGFGVSGGGIAILGLIDDVTRTVARKYCVLAGVAVVCCLPIGHIIRKFASRVKAADRLVNGVCTVVLTGLVVLSVLFLVGQSYNPFIYFRF